MLEYLYSHFPSVEWNGMFLIVLIALCIFLYQWGVATGEERAEQKLKEEEKHGTFNQITNR